MAEASDLQIKFPVKSVGITSLVLPRRRPGAGEAAAPTADKGAGANADEPLSLVAAAREEATKNHESLLRDLELSLRDFESQLSDRERVTAEQEKRLAERERELIQAEVTLSDAIEVLQKIKSSIHARRD